MGLRKDILSKIKLHINDDYSNSEVSAVPSLDNSKLTFGNTGLTFDGTVLYIDLRGSTSLLNSHSRSTVAKIHKSYYYTIVKIAKSLGGEPRSFNGDSLLVFFEGNSVNTLSNAVKAAMQMSYMLSSKDGISKYITKYTTIDFGIGLDYDSILCTKVGIGGTYDNKDLIWISNAINKSTVLSDEGKSPNHIYISELVYKNFNDEVKYYIDGSSGREKSIDMWKKTRVEYDKNWISCYFTSYYWVLG